MKSLKEIAKLGQVSPSTVSLVLHGKPGVSARTRSNILELLRNNEYHAQPAVEGKRSNAIRFLKFNNHRILVDCNESFISGVVDAITRNARKNGYDLVMTTCTIAEVESVVDLVCREMPKGVVILGTELEPEILSAFTAVTVPLLVVDNYAECQQFDSIVINNEELAFQAIEHLYQQGHRDIGYFHSKVYSSNFFERSCGYERALKRLKLPFSKSNVFFLPPTLDGAYQELKEALSAGRPLPPAVFADCDAIAIGACKALKEQGVELPGQLSIVGFDDIAYCTMADPPLTTMSMDCELLGDWAVRILLFRMQNPAAPVFKLRLGGKLIERGSTCPPAER